MSRRGDWIMTFTGREYWPMDPRPAEVDIYDIAHALSNLCRYTGHCARYFSVAEHSVLVSQLVPKHLAFVGLMHDATEAYVNDLARPLKHHLPQYMEAEARNWLAIAERYGLPAAIPDEVHDADNLALRMEYAALMHHTPQLPPVKAKDTKGLEVLGLPPLIARDVFLRRYFELARKP